MRSESAKRPVCILLPPHPRWRWGAYPLRWLLGGCCCLCWSPVQGLLYGSVFAVVAWVWARTLAMPTGPGLGLATTLTAFTLLLAPRLTAALVEQAAPAPWQLRTNDSRDALQSALFGLGVLLVLVLAVALNLAVFGFALLYSGHVPSLGLLPAELARWHNAPLMLVFALILSCALLVVQAVGFLPVFVLRQTDADLVAALRASLAAVRLNWRPFACWALSAQLLLLAGISLMPASLLLLAPLVAYGSWWACREAMPQAFDAAAGVACPDND